MKRTVRDALAQAARRLAQASVPDAARDARILLADAMGIAPDRLTLVAADAFPEAAATALEARLSARAARRPVSQIIGRRNFWGRTFEVSADVLDPRPETETLVALALQGPPPRRILDLGVGSGAILLTLLAEWPGAVGLGVDASAAALAVASRNAAALGVGSRAAFRLGDWFDGVEGEFDLIVSNPPYVSEAEVAALAPEVRDWEPRGALVPGPTGLEAYVVIASGLATRLAPGGRALFEIGADQGPAVSTLLRATGFADPAVHTDLDGRDRVVAVTAPEH